MIKQICILELSMHSDNETVPSSVFIGRFAGPVGRFGLVVVLGEGPAATMLHIPEIDYKKSGAPCIRARPLTPFGPAQRPNAPADGLAGAFSARTGCCR